MVVKRWKKNLPAFIVFSRDLPTVADIASEFAHTSTAALERALKEAEELAYASFWEQAQVLAEGVFHRGVTVISHGAAGLTLAADGLGNVEDWNTADHRLWAGFKQRVLAELSRLTNKGAIVRRIYNYYLIDWKAVLAK